MFRTRDQRTSEEFLSFHDGNEKVERLLQTLMCHLQLRVGFIFWRNEKKKSAVFHFSYRSKGVKTFQLMFSENQGWDCTKTMSFQNSWLLFFWQARLEWGRKNSTEIIIRPYNTKLVLGNCFSTFKLRFKLYRRFSETVSQNSSTCLQELLNRF